MPNPVKDDLSDLALDDDINVRMRGLERQRLNEAALKISRQRGAIIKPGTLARELINDGVDRIVDAPAERQRA